MKQALKVLAVALSAALYLPALGQQPAQQVSPPGAQQSSAATKSATVQGSIESIDREAESISLKAADGRITMMRLDRNMPNFGKLEKGDKVTARYTEAVLLSIVRSDGPAQPTTEAPSSAPDTGAAAVPMPPGEHSRMMATVTDVDPAAGKVTLQAPKGEEIQMKVRDRQALTDLKKGDEVVATYVEAFALSIVPQEDSQGSR
jgi:Cu/Ag efflux protein CusF